MENTISNKMDYSIVIPVYNSSKTLPVLFGELEVVISQVPGEFEVIFVDDSSEDNSWEVLKDIQKKSTNIKALRLAKNVGQWMATLAGIRHSDGKLIITIDDDLEYDTNDIGKLIHEYKQRDAYIIFGIPTEKKNKNLTYKLFFKIRDRLLRILFDKTQTESFKIFKREIYFNEEGEMFSHLHFEAYTKFTVANKYVRTVPVNYRKRYFGNSNHTLYMKMRLMIKYGIEYYRSPFKYPLYFLLLLFFIYFSGAYLNMRLPFMLIVTFLITITLLLILGILGKYLSSLYFKLKGLPEYIVIEKLGNYPGT
jgi:glycosyltransferase involved in cell wall biosynthesis